YSLLHILVNHPQLAHVIQLNLAQRVGRVPLLADFMAADSIDPEILANKKKNYAQFLIGEKEPVAINDYENRLL
ncbi:hypothetical protein NE645_18525, partial [Roseburia hominis]|nr:hypothetical protein [Roseburia hominis]